MSAPPPHSRQNRQLTPGRTRVDVDRHDRFQLRFMALGFGIGSMLFGFGAVVSMADGSASLANRSFALGAVGFTAAAFVQLLAAGDHLTPTERRTPRELLTSPDLVSAIVQFVGTLAFNAMTIRALAITYDEARFSLVWGPDVFGSAMFLISSWIAWHPIARHRRHRLLAGRSRAIVIANLAGSIFFAISAWGAQLIDGGVYRNLGWDNLGTLLGAIGFLIAAVLLWPWPGESTSKEAA